MNAQIESGRRSKPIKWLAENWFKLALLVAIAIALTLFAYQRNPSQYSQSAPSANTILNSSTLYSTSTDQSAGQTQPVTVLNSDIGAADIDPLLSGIVEIFCGTNDGYVQGSGSFWIMGNSYVVLTNKHVVASTYSDGSCMVSVSNQQDKPFGSFKIFPNNSGTENYQSDFAILNLVAYGPYGPKITNLNYGISDLPRCRPNMPIGSPVAVIGYPAFAQTKGQPFNTQGDMYEYDARTVTNGIISAYDVSYSQGYGANTSSALPYQSYFISNRIDHGSSGGIALSKNNGNLCVLGIPTWLNPGVSDTQGIVQNIDNLPF